MEFETLSVLAETEGFITALRTAEVLRAQEPFDFSVTYLMSLHRRLFHDVYEWAGKTRQVDMSRGTTRFAVWEQIDGECARLFEETQVWSRIDVLDRRELFLSTAAPFLVEMNVIHPFREGNGRTLRLFAELWARSIGLRLSWDYVEPQQYLAAMVHGFAHDSGQLRKVLEACLADSND